MKNDPKELKPGEGAVMTINGKKVAIYNDDGTLKAASAKCTHMGCTIGWNDGEKTFDCPCHGSRFTKDFQVLHGPAKKPLQPTDLPE